MVNAGEAYHEYHYYPMSLCLYYINTLKVNDKVSITFPTLFRTTKFEKCYSSYQKTLSTAA
jgi:hypothetical protein